MRGIDGPGANGESDVATSVSPSNRGWWHARGAAGKRRFRRGRRVARVVYPRTRGTSVSGYRTQSPDTSREAEEIQFEGYRKMESWQKLAIIDDLNKMVEGLARVGIRERHPDATEEEVRLRLAALRYGREFTIEWFGWDPDVEGW